MARKILLSAAAVALTFGVAAATAQERPRGGGDSIRAQQETPSTQPGSTQPGTQQRRAQPSRATQRDAQPGALDQERQTPRQRAQTPRSNPRAGQDRDNAQRASDRPRRNAQDRDTARRRENARDRQAGERENARTRDRRQNAKSQSQSPRQRASTPSRQKAQDQNTRSSRNARNGRSSGRANLTNRQRTRISRSIARLNVRPVRNVNFSISVGAVVPASLPFRPLPSSIVAIVPQYRGYDFVLVRDEIVIVQPRTHKIVAVLPYSGGASARASTRTNVSLSQQQRRVIRQSVVTHETTAVVPSSEIVVGETLPETVVVREFPETVYRTVPRIRSYRYLVRGDDVYLIDPSDRRIVEVIR